MAKLYMKLILLSLLYISLSAQTYTKVNGGYRAEHGGKIYYIPYVPIDVIEYSQRDGLHRAIVNVWYDKYVDELCNYKTQYLYSTVIDTSEAVVRKEAKRLRHVFLQRAFEELNSAYIGWEKITNK